MFVIIHFNFDKGNREIVLNQNYLKICVIVYLKWNIRLIT